MELEEAQAIFSYRADGTLLGRPFRMAGQYLAWDNGERNYYMHHLVWLLHKGYLPKMLDHINGDRLDNRIENLRECTPAQNQYNSVRKRNNKSGFKGVVEHKRCTLKKWQARITVSGEKLSLGYFATPEKASQAYAVAARRYAGEFAHPNPNRKKD